MARLPRVDIAGESYFLTVCCFHRIPWFKDASCAELMCRLILSIRGDNTMLHAYVVMPDHYHLIVTLAPNQGLREVIRRLNSRSARALNLLKGGRGRVWQPRFYDHVIRDEADFLTKLDYVHDNPRRSGLVSEPGEYRYSSFRYWELGDKTSGELDPWD